MRKIIDSHCHIYPDKIADKATEATGNFYSIQMDCRGTVSVLAEEAEKAGITHCLVQSVATTPAQVSSINNFIAEAVRGSENLAGLGTLHQDSDDFERDTDELISLGLKGVKMHPDIQRVAINDDRCMKIFEICERKGLPVLLHTGDKRYDFSNPDRMIPVLETFKNLTVIGAHFGGWSVWEDAAKELCGFKNFYVDTSSSLYAIKPSAARELVELYSDDRVLFGTDFPMWRPSEELERYMKLGFCDKQNEKIFFENAKRIFGLDW